MLQEIIDAVEKFVEQIEGGLFIVPPMAGSLGNYQPNISGLAHHRDELGIIQQIQDNDKDLDGGDSAHKTGILAFCNSTYDIDKLHYFETGGIMRRHPNRIPYNNWKNCSRDQLLAYIAGCWRAGKNDIVERLLFKHIARIPPFTCQNTENDFEGSQKNPPIGDPLGPHDMMHFAICAGHNEAHWDLYGQLALQLAIELTPKDVDLEYTQLLLESIVCGRLNHFVMIHDEYEENIRNYWGSRKQPQIGEDLIEVIKIELKRYENVIPFPPILPVATLNFLRTVNLSEELTNWDPKHKAALIARFAEAIFNDYQIQARQLYLIGLAVAKFTQRVLNEVIKWVGVALDFVENLVESGVTFTVNVLFGYLNQNNRDLNSLLQKFADEIVERLTKNMKSIIAEAFYNDDLAELKDRIRAIEEEFRDYLITKEKKKLENVDSSLYMAIAIAERLGLPTLSYYCILRSIQCAVFIEIRKENPAYPDTIKKHLLNAVTHIDALESDAVQKIHQSFSYTSHLLSKPHDPAEKQNNRYLIYYEGVLIKTEEFPVEKPWENTFDNYYNGLINEKTNQFKAAVTNPARELIAQLKASVTNLLYPKKNDLLNVYSNSPMSVMA